MPLLQTVRRQHWLYVVVLFVVFTGLATLGVRSLVKKKLPAKATPVQAKL